MFCLMTLIQQLQPRRALQIRHPCHRQHPPKRRDGVRLLQGEYLRLGARILCREAQLNVSNLQVFSKKTVSKTVTQASQKATTSVRGPRFNDGAEVLRWVTVACLGFPVLAFIRDSSLTNKKNRRVTLQRGKASEIWIGSHQE